MDGPPPRAATWPTCRCYEHDKKNMPLIRARFERKVAHGWLYQVPLVCFTKVDVINYCIVLVFGRSLIMQNTLPYSTRKKGSCTALYMCFGAHRMRPLG